MKDDTRNSNTVVVMIRLRGELAAKPGTMDLLQHHVRRKPIYCHYQPSDDKPRLISSFFAQVGLVVSKSYAIHKIQVMPSAA